MYSLCYKLVEISLNSSSMLVFCCSTLSNMPIIRPVALQFLREADIRFSLVLWLLGISHLILTHLRKTKVEHQ